MNSRRIVCHEFGPPENLKIEGSSLPSPKENEVLIRMNSAGVGFVVSDNPHYIVELYSFIIKQQLVRVKMAFVPSLQIKVDLIALPRINAPM